MPKLASKATPAGVFPTHDSFYGQGGYREVATLAARDAIDPAFLKNDDGSWRAGAQVSVTADPTWYNNTVWQLKSDGTYFDAGFAGGAKRAGRIYATQHPAWISGADCSVAWGALLGQASGQTLVLPDGTFKIDARTLLAGYSKIVGSGNTVLQLLPGQNNDILFASGLDNLVFEDLIFDGAQTDQNMALEPNLAGSCIQFIKCNNLRFTRCIFRNSLGNGFRLVGCTRVLVEACISDDQYANGFYLSAHTDGTYCDDVDFIACGGKGIGFKDGINQKFEMFSNDPGTRNVRYINCWADTVDGFGINCFAGTLGAVTGDVYGIHIVGFDARNCQFGAIGISGAHDVFFDVDFKTVGLDAAIVGHDVDRIHAVTIVQDTTPAVAQPAAYNITGKVRGDDCGGNIVLIKGAAGKTIKNVTIDIGANNPGSGFDGVDIDYTDSNITLTGPGITYAGRTMPFAVQCLSANALGVRVFMSMPQAGGSGYVKGVAGTIYSHAGEDGVQRNSHDLWIGERGASYAEARLISGANGVGGVRFADPDAVSGALEYNHQYDLFQFVTSGAIRAYMGANIWYPITDGAFSFGSDFNRLNNIFAMGLKLWGPLIGNAGAVVIGDGTVTNGNLTLKAKSDGESWLYFGNETTAHVGYFRSYPSGYLAFGYNSANVINFSPIGDIYPQTSAASDLGTAGHVWNAIRGTTLSLTTGATIGDGSATGQSLTLLSKSTAEVYLYFGNETTAHVNYIRSYPSGYMAFGYNGSNLLNLSNDSKLYPQTDATGYLGTLSNQFQYACLSNALYVAGNQVVAARQTGWTAGTGTANKGAFATGTATATDCAQRILALEQALRTHGLIN